METMIMRDGVVVCSKEEARRWGEAYEGALPAPGDTLIQFRGNAAPEIGRIGIAGATITQPSESQPPQV